MKSIADSLVTTNVVTVPALVSVVLIQKVREAAEVATTHRVLPDPEDDPLTRGWTVLLSHRDVPHTVKLELALTKTLLLSHKISTSITMIFIYRVKKLLHWFQSFGSLLTSKLTTSGES